MSNLRHRICVVTGSRAEYGLLYWVLHDLRADPSIELQLVATGMHLAPEFGSTVHDIERDGFDISRRVEMLVSSDAPGAVAKSIALGVMGMSDAFQQLEPDIVLLLGDRFEILAAAQACLVHNIPIAHIAGGDITEGAFDDSIRHAITKMAHVHFVTNADSAARVLQLGEDPALVHVVGSPGLDHLRRQQLLSRQELELALGAPLGAENFLVTFHPVTLHDDHGQGQCAEMLAALECFPDANIWFTQANADPGGRAINALVAEWAARHSHRARIYNSLGQIRYLSLMAHVHAVVGNSSSGLYEAPSLFVPTVDIGDRQGGRLAADSVIRCVAERDAIAEAIRRALHFDCRGIVNPYGDGQTAPRIVEGLKAALRVPRLRFKRFHSPPGHFNV